MSGRRAARLLHAGHAVATLVLLATGALILSPDLRAELVGGYGRQLAELHVLGGYAFSALPLAAALLSGRGLAANLRERLRRGGAHPGWPRAHLLITLLASLLAVLTGFGLLADLPNRLFDATRTAHVTAHYALFASLVLHLVLARRAIADRILLLLGREPAPLFEWVDEPGDPEEPGGSD